MFLSIIMWLLKVTYSCVFIVDLDVLDALQCVPPTEEHGDVQLRTSCRSELSIYRSGLQYNMVSNIFIIACLIPLRDNFVLLWLTEQDL